MRAALIWDVDGTLVDTAEHHFAAWQALAQEIDRPFSRADFQRTFGWRNPEILRTLFTPDASESVCEQLALRKENHYREAVRREGSRLLPGVGVLLNSAAQAGIPQALGSSAPRGNLELLIEVTDTARYFQAIVCGDDVQRGKPDPEVFLRAAHQLAVEPTNCIVLEDAVVGVEAAVRAGMRCVAIAGHHSAEKLAAAGATWVVPSLEEITLEQLFSTVEKPSA